MRRLASRAKSVHRFRLRIPHGSWGKASVLLVNQLAGVIIRMKVLASKWPFPGHTGQLNVTRLISFPRGCSVHMCGVPDVTFDIQANATSVAQACNNQPTTRGKSGSDYYIHTGTANLSLHWLPSVMLTLTERCLLRH